MLLKEGETVVRIGGETMNGSDALSKRYIRVRRN